MDDFKITNEFQILWYFTRDDFQNTTNSLLLDDWKEMKHIPIMIEAIKSRFDDNTKMLEWARVIFQQVMQHYQSLFKDTVVGETLTDFWVFLEIFIKIQFYFYCNNIGKTKIMSYLTGSFIPLYFWCIGSKHWPVSRISGILKTANVSPTIVL